MSTGPKKETRVCDNHTQNPKGCPFYIPGTSFCERTGHDVDQMASCDYGMPVIPSDKKQGGLEKSTSQTRIGPGTFGVPKSPFVYRPVGVAEESGPELEEHESPGHIPTTHYAMTAVTGVYRDQSQKPKSADQIDSVASTGPFPPVTDGHDLPDNL